VVLVANSKHAARKKMKKKELVIDFKVNFSRPQSNMFTTMTSNEEKLCNYKSSTNHVHVLFFLEILF
jgi:hypothetical protein